jgi:hypothetical protein
MFYKVVALDRNGKFWSIGVSPLLQQIAVEYRVGEWVKPLIPDSKLFVYSTEQAARRTFNEDPAIQDIQVFECEVQNPVRCDDLFLAFYYVEMFLFKAKQAKQQVTKDHEEILRNGIAEYWQNKNSGTPDKAYTISPLNDTFFADAVMLGKRIR